MMTARFATATGLLVGASLTTAAAAVADPGDTVTYTVSSDGPLVSVSYYDEMANMRQITDQPANWSTTFTSETTSGLFAVGAKTTGEEVYCQITINGEVRDQKSAVGQYSSANCSAPIYASPPTTAAPYVSSLTH
jgi:Mycobacterium membrane protein